jgi:hypothetical protein
MRRNPQETVGGTWRKKMVKRIIVGDRVSKRLFTSRFDKYAWRVLDEYVKEEKKDKYFVDFLVKPLPTPEEYVKLRDAKYTQTLQSLVSEAYGEAQGLRDELQEWYDNLPESFQNGDKGSDLQEAVDTLSNFCDEEPEIPVAARDLKIVFLPGDVDSRSDRAGEAGSQMRMVANSLDKYIGNKKLEGDELTEIQEIVDLLNEHAEELEQVSFPGMY